MNIKEHIEAGHYPTDDKGRAIVPTDGGGPITIYATDHGSAYPICGRHPACEHAETWTACGQNFDGNGDLLPPPPRKVKVTRWLLKETTPCVGETSLFPSRDAAEAHLRSAMVNPEWWHLIEMTGEYEESWS